MPRRPTRSGSPNPVRPRCKEAQAKAPKLITDQRVEALKAGSEEERQSCPPCPKTQSPPAALRKLVKRSALGPMLGQNGHTPCAVRRQGTRHPARQSRAGQDQSGEGSRAGFKLCARTLSAASKLAAHRAVPSRPISTRAASRLRIVANGFRCRSIASAIV